MHGGKEAHLLSWISHQQGGSNSQAFWALKWKEFPLPRPLVPGFKINHSMTSTKTYICIILFLKTDLNFLVGLFQFIHFQFHEMWLDLPVIYNWITSVYPVTSPVTYCHLGKFLPWSPFLLLSFSWTTFWCRGWGRVVGVWHHAFARGPWTSCWLPGHICSWALTGLHWGFSCRIILSLHLALWAGYIQCSIYQLGAAMFCSLGMVNVRHSFPHQHHHHCCL